MWSRVSPVLRGTVSARSGFENANGRAVRHRSGSARARRPDILHQLIDGNFDDFRNNTSSIIIGSRLAELLQAGVGETTVQLPRAQRRVWEIQCLLAIPLGAGIGSIDSTRIYSHAPKSHRHCLPTALRRIHDHLQAGATGIGAPVLASRYRIPFSSTMP